MHIYDKLGERPQVIRELGERARAKAREAGVPSYYEDPCLGSGIVEELPDGTRRLIEQTGSEDVNDVKSGPR